ncbi:hypothetical protein E4U57_005498 [Claviceps arundinis]|uniref:Phosphatidylinositol-specific phospholipase C X domain-containing protein n=1 Tax=Claviceps arundinis TaxID=1623583 RepID=A0A9P7SNC4_9HYPO|nr:hypothetical protein E4U56_004211 [Claviceps arundinis]KAG5964250.1 hypothetical protein E4U57_005498 [Claviceps arundinis]
MQASPIKDTVTMLLPHQDPRLPLQRHHRHLHTPRSHRQFAILTVLTGAGIMMLLYVLLSLAPCLVSGVCYKGYESDYSFNANAARNPSWMRHLPDDLNITSLSIPGTHDTMTYSIKKFHLQCQNWNLTTQLNAGLRYVDIRARVKDDHLHIFHASEPTGYSYQDVLLALFAFLDANPSETIIMRLKREGGPIGHRNKRSFQDAFNYARLHDPVTQPGAAKHLFLYNGSAMPIPTLGQLRSKVFILQNWKDTSPHGKNEVYGLEWEGPQMILEDRFIIPSPSHLEYKWEAIHEALEKANADPLDNKHLYLAHLSASIGVLPIEAAAGTKNETYPRGMNDKTGAWLEQNLKGGVRTGIVIFDFPGRRGIEAVIDWNRHFTGSLGK